MPCWKQDTLVLLTIIMMFAVAFICRTWINAVYSHYSWKSVACCISSIVVERAFGEIYDRPSTILGLIHVTWSIFFADVVPSYHNNITAVDCIQKSNIRWLMGSLLIYFLFHHLLRDCDIKYALSRLHVLNRNWRSYGCQIWHRPNWSSCWTASLSDTHVNQQDSWTMYSSIRCLPWHPGTL